MPVLNPLRQGCRRGAPMDGFTACLVLVFASPQVVYAQLMAEVAHSGEHHGDAVFVGCINHFLVAH